MEAVHLAVVIALGFAAGTIGALLGLGGGIFLVPALTWIFGLPVRQAAGVGLMTVIATSGAVSSETVRHGFVNTAATLKTVDRATETFDVRKAKRDPEAASLSGGNLQKFIVGREILRNPVVLVVSKPTWGVDAGAAAVIRQALLDLAAGGAAVLVTSQDLDELAEITDRIAVMFHGHLSEPLATSEASREKLGLLMGGSTLDQKEQAHAVGA